MSYRVLGYGNSSLCQILAKSFRETIGPPRFIEFANRFLIVNSCVARKPLDVRSGGPGFRNSQQALPNFIGASLLK
jgi:hypothetical protein